jgi:hypothetical protein
MMNEKTKQLWLELDAWTGLQVLFMIGEGVITGSNYIKVRMMAEEFLMEIERSLKEGRPYPKIEDEKVPFIWALTALSDLGRYLVNGVTMGALTPMGEDYCGSGENATVVAVLHKDHPILRQLFIPEQVIRWAASKRSIFPAFPFTLDDIQPGAKEQAKGKETPAQRRERLAKERGEMTAAGEKGVLKKLADKEGVSITRIKQVLKEHEELGNTGDVFGIANQLQRAQKKSR